MWRRRNSVVSRACVPAVAPGLADVVAGPLESAVVAEVALLVACPVAEAVVVCRIVRVLWAMGLKEEGEVVVDSLPVAKDTRLST
jgi:hypothetical protein